MGKLIMLTGGTRSGKSDYAKDLARDYGDSILYIATLVPSDEDMRFRIEKQQQLRPESWDTLEAYKNIDTYITDFGAGYDAIILDCVCFMIHNFMADYDIDWETAPRPMIDKIKEEIKKNIKTLMDEAKIVPAPIIMVTNELGLGVAAPSRFLSIYCDLVGKCNTYLASVSDEVHFMVSGIPIQIK